MPRLSRLLLPDALFALLLAATLLLPAPPAVAQRAQLRPVVTGEDGPSWRELSPSQRTTLKPLEREWPSIAPQRKQKWLEIAARYPSLPRTEQERISARMSAWAGMSPADRDQARRNYQEARRLSAEERRARWQTYQSLTPEQRRELAARAAPPLSSDSSRRRADRQRVQGDAKSNLVPNPAYAARPRPVAPAVVQARPGASTTLISKRPAPPTHQQPGLPKIAATPGFVDKATLLPQRGPQGAASRDPEKRRGKSQ